MNGPFSLQPGNLFAGRFRIVRVLGHGGMGTVYEAIHEATGAARALKLMLPQFAEDTRFLKRFSQEARISALIESDHVVQVLDVGFDEATHSPYLVMELLRGESLTGYVLRKQRLNFSELRFIFIHIFHALCAAHEAGIIHRDLKPENIFLTRTKREGVPFTTKILDFGIAKMHSESQTTATIRLGSPLWVAPEQTETHRSSHPSVDLWALGLLAFFCLTGRSYWLRANEESFSIPALMRELLFEPLAAASERAAAFQIASAIPPGFDAWFARCVHRDPAARFSSTTEARDHLLALLPVDEDLFIEPLPEMTGAFAQAQFPANFLAQSSSQSLESPPASTPSYGSSIQNPLEPTQPSEARLRSDTLAIVEQFRAPRRRALQIVGATALLSGIVALVLQRSLLEADQPPLAILSAHQHIEASPPNSSPLPSPEVSSAQVEIAKQKIPDSSNLIEPPEKPEEKRKLAAAPSAADLPREASTRSHSPPIDPGQGFLSVVCRPYCDAVQVKGRNLGSTPLLRSPLAPGAYTAKLLRKGQAPRTISFAVQQGQTTVLQVNLEETSKTFCNPAYTVDQEGNKRIKPECREL